MLDAMATTKTTRPRKPAPRTFTQIGREAAGAAQRAALLDAGRRLGWNLSAIARELAIGSASHVLRALDRLDLLGVYEAERPRRQ